MNRTKLILKREITMLVSLFLFIHISLGQLYNFKKISVEQGLSAPGVYSICEGPKGRLWIGLEGEGVNIYDGWEIVHYSDHFIGTNVRAILKSSNNAMVFGSEHEGLSILSKNRCTKITTDDGLFVNHIRGIAEDRKGLFWVATFGGGVSVIQDNEVIRNFHEKSGMPSLYCRAIHVRENDEVWVGTDHGIAIISDGKVQKVLNESDGLTHHKILSIKESNGTVWIGTQSGLTAISEHDTVHISTNNELVDLRVKCLEIGVDGEIWMGTHSGIGKISKQSLKNKKFSVSWFNDENGLSNNRVRCLYVDESKALWAGTYFGGVNRLFNESFSMHDKNNGLLDNVIMAVEWNKTDSSIWLGTHDHGLDVFTKGEPLLINKSNGLSENHVTAIAHLKKGCSVVGTVDGLNLVKNNEIERVWDSYDGVFKGSHITNVVSNEEGVLGVTINNELFYLNDSGEVYLDRIISQRLNQLFPDVGKSISVMSNVFWVTSDSSICALKVGKTSVEIEREIFIDKVANIIGDSLHVLGFTRKNTLFKMDGDSIVWELQLGKSEEIKFLLKEDVNSYWVGLKGRILHVCFLNKNKCDLKYFSLNEGFMGGAAMKSSVTKNEDGDIFVGTIRGLLKIKPKTYKGVKRDLQVYLDDILYNNRRIDWSRYSDSIVEGIPYGLKLPYKMNHLTFKYKSYHLKSPDEVLYKIDLIGQEDFNFETSRTDEEFVDLSPGDYEIKISAKTQWGDWSENPMRLAFEITPPFWMRSWFQILAILLFTGSLFMVFKLRTRKLEREKLKLELLVDERTSDLNAEKQKSEELLLNILPQDVAQELKVNGAAKTRKYEKAAVLFTDFKGFTKMSSEMSPELLVGKLDEIFRAFDEVMEKYDLEKIKTIGDAYMCVSGIHGNSTDQIKNIVLAGLQLIDIMNEFNEKQSANNEPIWELRVGVHTGELIAGVVGKKKFAYDVWGDTVNVASRMESNSEPGKLNISKETYVEVKSFFNCTYRGKIYAKNRGELGMYFVDGVKSE